MFTSGVEGAHFWGVFAIFVLGGQSVYGRPQNLYKSGAKESPDSLLRFYPELLFEPSLESAVSPISLLPPRPPHTNKPPEKPEENFDPDTPKDDVDDLLKRISDDLDGPEDEWESDPDVLDTNIVDVVPEKPAEKIQELPRHRVIVEPVLEDDVDVDRKDGHLLDFSAEDEDDEFEEVSQKKQFLYPTNHGSKLDEESAIPAQKMLKRDMDLDEAPPAHTADIPMPDDVPSAPHEVLPWQEMLQKDIDIDTPVLNHDTHSADDSDLPKELRLWKKIAVADLDEEDNISDIDVDEEGSASFDDSDEDDDDELPEELVWEVIQAMEAEPEWRKSLVSAPGKEESVLLHDTKLKGQDEEQDANLEAQKPNSRFFALIFEAVDDSSDVGKKMEKKLEAQNKGKYAEKLGVWQILTNFPFPMLLRSADDALDTSDDDEYYDEDYYDDEYDDDEYDNEDYDDDDDDDDDENDNEEDNKVEIQEIRIKVGKDDADMADDFFYFNDYEDYEDCDDCIFVDEDEKELFADLVLPPLLTM